MEGMELCRRKNRAVNILWSLMIPRDTYWEWNDLIHYLRVAGLEWLPDHICYLLLNLNSLYTYTTYIDNILIWSLKVSKYIFWIGMEQNTLWNKYACFQSNVFVSVIPLWYQRPNPHPPETTGRVGHMRETGLMLGNPWPPGASRYLPVLLPLTLGSWNPCFDTSPELLFFYGCCLPPSHFWPSLEGLLLHLFHRHFPSAAVAHLSSSLLCTTPFGS